MFRAFKTHEGPRANQAEVINVGSQRSQGITNYAIRTFDTRDSIILKTEVEAFSKGGMAGVSAPNQQKMTERKNQRIMQAAQKKRFEEKWNSMIIFILMKGQEKMTLS